MFVRRTVKRRRRLNSAAAAERLETRELLAAAGSVSGQVFYDVDGNGVPGENEDGIPGVLVTLTGRTDSGEDVTRRYITRADGSFRFDGLQDGVYQLSQQQPEALADGVDQTTADGVVAGDDRYTNIVISDDNQVSGLNFGEGRIDAGYVSPIWLFASSATEEFHREKRAMVEADAGNDEFAEAIRTGAEEVDSDFSLNAAPEAVADSYSIAANNRLNVTRTEGVLANDTDPEGSALSAELIDGPDNGSLTLNTDGSFSYTPDAAFIGTDSFTYLANDGFKDSNSTTVSISVGDPNTFTVSESNAVEGDLVGTLTSIDEIDAPTTFQFATESPQPELGLLPDDRMVGLADSPALLIEYVDFACPACKAYHDTIAGFETSFAGDLLVVHRYFSRLTNFNSLEASIAVEAAARQGLYSAMADLLFENQAEWRVADNPNELFEQYIEDANLNLDLDQYRQDIADPTTEARVQRDFQSATDLQLSGTPTFFLNGERIANPPLEPVNEFPATISAAVSAARQNPFKVDRLSGELMVLNPSQLDRSTDPVETFDVELRNETETETITVTVNVSE